MLKSPSIMGLHLRYRHWIAELNHNIDLLRIFSDYLNEIGNKQNVPEIQARVSHFKDLFTHLRNEIDDLRHEMHLIKMTLASDARDVVNTPLTQHQNDEHNTLKHRYENYREQFDSMKDEFSAFVDDWL